MKRKVWPISLFILILLLLSSAVVMASVSESSQLDAQAIPPIQVKTSNTTAVQALAAMTFTTVITVDTTVDGGSGCPSSPCNLRHALVEARSLSPAERPVLIAFDIPLTDTNYALDGITGTWTIIMEGLGYTYGLDTPTILEPESLITIDGDTQPNGRSDGPKIIINSGYSLEALKEGNVIRNLAFNGGGGIYLNESSNVGGGNLVENVWVGLRADGQEIVLGDNPNLSPSGNGITVFSDNNVISGTIVTGQDLAITVQGDNNLIQYNTIGTRSDKTVPVDRLKCDEPSNLYNPAEWYGGGSIKFQNGSNNQVLSNTMAAIHIPHSPTETFPPAIITAGSDNLFAYNIIGLDGNGAEVGVCGQGFDATGHGTRILSNTIVRSMTSYEVSGGPTPRSEGAVFYTDSSPLARQITIRNNIVRDSTSKVIDFGPMVPDALRLFEPPQIFIITDTLVVGETQPGYDCPNCLIELYLDDLDSEQDALELLTTAVVISSTGRFTATLPAPLPANHGIRVTATTQDDNIIGNFWAGTTTKMSPAYGPDATFTRDLGPGWNLFSFDVMPTSNVISDVLSSLSGQYDLVLGFEGGPGGGGRTFEPGNPASDLLTMDSGHGYWINITAPTTQTFSLNYEPTRNDTEITLYTGWNLVSYLPDRTWPVSQALQSIAGSYELVQSFDGGAQTYLPGEPLFSDFTEMKPGFAYWIKIKELAGTKTLIYPPYTAPKKPAEAAAVPGVTASGFFTPTTEWADFYGAATLSGNSAPGGATVLAYDPDGVLAGGFSVHSPAWYGILHVYGDDPNTPVDEGAEMGDLLTFTIDGRLAKPQQGKTLTWNGQGALNNINIDAEIHYQATTVWSDFYGTLTIAGDPAPAGTILAAYDPSGVYIGDFIIEAPGQFGFLHTYADDPDTTEDEGAEMNDAISFRAFLPLSETPLLIMVDSGNPTWSGQGSRAQLSLSSTGEIATVAPTNISIAGPSMGMPATPYTFTITVDPADVTTPITYTVQRTDFAPITQTVDSRVVTLPFQWALTGTKTITVVADNGHGVVTDVHTILISTDVATDVAPSGVSIAGLSSGMPGTPYTFTVTVNPVNVTTPITYTIQQTDIAPITQTEDSRIVALSSQWVMTGTKIITVVANNGHGVATDTHTIVISADGGGNKVYLPLIVK